MKVTVIPIVTDALGTIPKVVVKRLDDLKIKGQVETIQTTPLLKSARILRRVPETCGGLLSLNLVGVKNSQRSKIMIIKQKSD